MDNMHDRRERTLYVSMLHKSVTDEHLYDLFAKAGPIEKVVFKQNMDGSPQHALVVFRHISSITSAMEKLQGFPVHGQPIHIRPLRESSHPLSRYATAWTPMNSDDPFSGEFSDPDTCLTSLRNIHVTSPCDINRDSARPMFSWDRFTPPTPSDSPPAHTYFDSGIVRAPLVRSNSNPWDKWGSSEAPRIDLLSPPLSAGFLGMNSACSTGSGSAFPLFSGDGKDGFIEPIGFERERSTSKNWNQNKPPGSNGVSRTFDGSSVPQYQSANTAMRRHSEYDYNQKKNEYFNNFRAPSNQAARARAHRITRVDVPEETDGFARWAASGTGTDRGTSFRRSSYRF